jgi:DNA-directed RNA polymerase specialized sigma24 family protein
MQEQPEREPVENSRPSVQAAIAGLFRRNYPWRLRHARSILRSEPDAQDAGQSAGHALG